MSGFDFRPIDLSDGGIEATAELLRTVFPEAHHMTAAYLKSLYFGNPVGETWGLCCHDADGRLIGHTIMIPIKARILGEEEVGIWPFQLATHPEARMRGLFKALITTVFDHARERGFRFLSGVGNQNSTPILAKILGPGTVVGPLDVKLGVGPTPPSKPMPDCNFRRVWDDAALIRWRLGHATGEPYRVRWRGDTGYLYADTGRLGIQAEIGHFARALLPRGLPELAGGNPLRLWIGLDPTRRWSTSPYFDVPKRLRPSPLNLLWHDLSGRGRRLSPDKVQYEVFAFDAF